MKTDTIDKAWHTFIEDYAFQVPYNGTQEFYNNEKINDKRLEETFKKVVAETIATEREMIKKELIKVFKSDYIRLSVRTKLIDSL